MYFTPIKRNKQSVGFNTGKARKSLEIDHNISHQKNNKSYKALNYKIINRGVYIANVIYVRKYNGRTSTVYTTA